MPTADAQPASSNSLVQNGSINGIPVWAYGVMGMLAGLIVLSILGRSHAGLLEWSAYLAPVLSYPLVAFMCATEVNFKVHGPTFALYTSGPCNHQAMDVLQPEKASWVQATADSGGIRNGRLTRSRQSTSQRCSPS